ncbi:hypothetical protein TNCV_4700211 [Trichonephila clavipes]|nr:hypothetical protein TNCV_4700211 [Trichonephila clavipes]
MSSSLVELKTRRAEGAEARMSRLKSLPVGVARMLEEEWCLLRCHPRHLNPTSKLRGQSTKVFLQLSSACS